MSTSRTGLSDRCACLPPEYRAARGDEIMATLMDSRGDGHVSPLREFVALVVDGSRRRLGLRPVSGVAAWRSGARLAAFLLAFLTTAVALLGVIQERRNPTIGGSGFGPRLDVASLALTPWFAMFAITAIGTLVALAFGARRVAMVFAVAGALTQVFELAGGGSHYIVYDWTNASSLPREPLHWLIPSVLLPGLIAAGRISRRRAVAAVPLAAGLLVAAAGSGGRDQSRVGRVRRALAGAGRVRAGGSAIAPFDPRPRDRHDSPAGCGGADDLDVRGRRQHHAGDLRNAAPGGAAPGRGPVRRGRAAHHARSSARDAGVAL